MWGQVQVTALLAILQRIIPTRVGTSSTALRRRLRPQDHPHACGDKWFARIGGQNQRGSSPRVWGQALDLLEQIIVKRIIPTRVGTRSYQPRQAASSQDHPHACGDKAPASCKTGQGSGSSPRVWGQVKDRFPERGLRGIIPTRVGTSMTEEEIVKAC